jgi:RNA polymerase sigma-70 factor (ECF subfamily)
VDEEESPEASLVQQEVIGAVRQFMEELDEPDRELVKLKYFEDLKYREISTQTGLNIGNVGYRLHHILKELAARLRKLGFDEKS